MKLQKLSLAMIVLFSTAAHAIKAGDLCDKIVQTVGPNTGSECMALVRGAYFDLGAVDVCMKILGTTGPNTAIECLKIIKDKDFLQGTAACLTIVSTTGPNTAKDCLKGAATPHVAGSANGSGCNFGDIEARIDSAIRKLEANQKTRALEILKSLQAELNEKLRVVPETTRPRRH